MRKDLFLWTCLIASFLVISSVMLVFFRRGSPTLVEETSVPEQTPATQEVPTVQGVPGEGSGPYSSHYDGRYGSSSPLPRYQSREELPENLRLRIQQLYAAKDRRFTALDETVKDFSVVDATVPEAVAQLSNDCNFLCGIEAIPWPPDPEGWPTVSFQRISLSLQQATPRQILNRLVSMDPAFTWFEDQGFANIVMGQAYESPDYPLNSRVPKFQVEDRQYTKVFLSPGAEPALFMVPQVGESLAISITGRWPQELEPRVSVDAVDATVRCIINDVARKVGMSWVMVASHVRNNKRVARFVMHPTLPLGAYYSWQ